MTACRWVLGITAVLLLVAGPVGAWDRPDMEIQREHITISVEPDGAVTVREELTVDVRVSRFPFRRRVTGSHEWLPSEGRLRAVRIDSLEVTVDGSAVGEGDPGDPTVGEEVVAVDLEPGVHELVAVYELAGAVDRPGDLPVVELHLDLRARVVHTVDADRLLVLDGVAPRSVACDVGGQVCAEVEPSRFRPAPREGPLNVTATYSAGDVAPSTPVVLDLDPRTFAEQRADLRRGRSQARIYALVAMSVVVGAVLVAQRRRRRRQPPPDVPRWID